MLPFAKRQVVGQVDGAGSGPVGTVIITGDQPVAGFGFAAAQVAVEPVTAAPQL